MMNRRARTHQEKKKEREREELSMHLHSMHRVARGYRSSTLRRYIDMHRYIIAKMRQRNT